MAESYLVLARKWRPLRFEDLLGQAHVARTLANAIRSGRVAHAFLFAGVRGVGKTSAARILARALTCREGPTPEPCGSCDACATITSGTATDVQEIDGASNNSVEDIRRLRENVVYQPSSLRAKIYIIDEVHMLSQSAFNALLKTLEEPPPHVKFVFATTEPHKIPVTILSRCQRYDFRRIPTRQIAGRLERILEDESIRLENAAVRIIAEEASGSMRDALSLLDQVLAAFPQGTDAREVTWLLGVTPQALLARTAAAVVARDTRGALEAVAEADDAGYDLQQFARSFLRYLRDLLVLASCPDAPGLTDLADAEEAGARDIVRNTTVPHLHRLFGLASRFVDDVARSPLPRVHADVAVARMATADTVVPIADVLARLERLPVGRDGGGRDGGASTPPAPSRGPASPPSAGGRRGAGPRRAAPASPAAPPPDDDVPPPEAEDPLATARGPAVVGGLAAGSGRNGRDGESEPGRRPGRDREAERRHASGRESDHDDDHDDPSADSGHGAHADDHDDDHAHAHARGTGDPREGWGAVVAEVGKVDGLFAGMLAQAVPTSWSAERVALAFPESSTAADLLRQPRRAEALSRAIERVLGAPAAVEIDDASSDAARAVAERAAEKRAAEDRAREEMLDHPAVREALRAFDGSRVVDVRAGNRSGGGKGARQR